METFLWNSGNIMYIIEGTITTEKMILSFNRSIDGFLEGCSNAMRNNLSRVVFVFVLFVCLGQAAYYYPLRPDRVASHFGVSGRPDAWASKESFMKIYLVAVGFITVLFSGIGCVLRRTSDSLINLPNKDYWLSPERREETMDFLSRRFLGFGSATLLLFLDMFHQSFRVHLGRASALEHPAASIVAYVAFSVLWSATMIVKFTRQS